MAQTELLAAGTEMGAVTLFVENLERVRAFYQQGVGLEVLRDTTGTVVLGRGSIPILILEQRKELARAAQGSAGLFHTAILFDTEEALASSVYSIATKYPNLFTGSSDHFVSLAFYFDDPEGNGVELYWDFPREKWQNLTDKMTTAYLDPNLFLKTHLNESLAAAPLASAAKVGHVHLQVGTIPEALDFYTEKLGFELQLLYGKQALFVSAGGYHHHIGMNTWNSQGAGLRSPALGLGQLNILVPSLDEVIASNERLNHHGVVSEFDGKTLSLLDPWANKIQLGVG
ncbi:MAG: VOC family protein [Microbacteriaceae bacterium]